MELKKSNALKVCGLAIGLVIGVSCSSEEAKNEGKPQSTEQEPEVKLNSLLVGDIEFLTEYTEAKSIEEKQISSPFGEIRSLKTLVYDAEDTLIVWVNKYDSLPETPMMDLMAGEVYSRFGEEVTFEVDSSNSTMIQTHFGDSLFWEYRKSYNLTSLIESRKPLEKRIEIGVVSPPEAD